MGEVIEMRLPLEQHEAAYLTGRTLRIIAGIRGKVLFDTDGTPVLDDEFYEITSEGIKRVA